MSVEQAVRKIGAGTFGTLADRTPVDVAFSDDALNLRVGKGWLIRVPWGCIEGVPQFVEKHGVVKVNSGGDLSHPNCKTLDGYLKS